MSGKPAARLNDMIKCSLPIPLPGGLLHTIPPGHPIVLIGAPVVLIGGLPAARVGDFTFCATPLPLPNPIISGAFPVPIMSMPAARQSDPGTCPGSSIQPPCCPTVEIGLSGTTGSPPAGTAACNAMGGGRNPAPGSTDTNGNPLQPQSQGQSYNNCGIESSRQLVQQSTGSNPGQEAMLQSAVSSGNATQPAIGSMVNGNPVTAANQSWHSGGTFASGQAAILGNNGVPASTIAPGAGNPVGAVSVSQYQVPLSQGRGVIANGDVSGLPGWGTQQGGHAVTVTGLDYDDNGNITNVHYTDTGIGNCQGTATQAQFQTFLSNSAASRQANGWSPFSSTVTDNSVWW